MRTVHLSNIANVAYANCAILESRGIGVELYCHDMTHIMSQPEWNDLVLDLADFPDENDFFNNTADLSGYNRPNWFHSGTLFSLMLFSETLAGSGRVRSGERPVPKVAAMSLATAVNFAFGKLIKIAAKLLAATVLFAFSMLDHDR